MPVNCKTKMLLKIWRKKESKFLYLSSTLTYQTFHANPVKYIFPESLNTVDHKGIFIKGILDKMMFLGLSFSVISFMSLAPIIDVTALRFKDAFFLDWQYVLLLQDAHEFFHVLSSTLDDEMVMMALCRLLYLLWFF